MVRSIPPVASHLLQYPKHSVDQRFGDVNARHGIYLPEPTFVGLDAHRDWQNKYVPVLLLSSRGILQRSYTLACGSILSPIFS